MTATLDALKSFDMVYLATPYTKYKTGIHHAFVDAATLACEFVRAGINVFSPITMTHPMAIYGNIDPKDVDLWVEHDKKMMNIADIAVVALMPGWRESKGVTFEIDYFRKYNKPVWYLHPDTLLLSKEANEDTQQERQLGAA